MFKIFSFQLGNIFNLNNITKINGVMHSFLDNIDISEFTENYKDDLSNEHHEEKEKLGNEEFIKLEQYEDMYLLTINLRGIDLRELSIRYDPGIIEINLNRAEIEKSSFGILANNILVKKAYNEKFENIEEIDTSKVLRSIDNGILSMRMQKKYTLLESIVDVDSYEYNANS